MIALHRPLLTLTLVGFHLTIAYSPSQPRRTSVRDLPVIPIAVPLADYNQRLTKPVFVYEVSDYEWWGRQNEADNPYGGKLWPGAVATAQRLAQCLASRPERSPTILEIGAGNGLCSIAAALTGARVLATDISPLALTLLKAAAVDQDCSSRIKIATFDICSSAALPPADIVLVADLLYDSTLAFHAARRVLEAAERGSEVIVGGDPKRAARQTFLDHLAGHDLEQAHDRLHGSPMDPSSRSVFFEPPFTVSLEAAKWKAKQVEVGHVRSRQRRSGSSVITGTQPSRIGASGDPG